MPKRYMIINYGWVMHAKRTPVLKTVDFQSFFLTTDLQSQWSHQCFQETIDWIDALFLSGDEVLSFFSVSIARSSFLKRIIDYMRDGM